MSVPSGELLRFDVTRRDLENTSFCCPFNLYFDSLKIF